MTDFDLTYKQCSANAILVEWPSEINKDILNERIGLQKALEDKLHEVIVEIIPAYNSLLIIYKLYIENIYDAISTLKQCYQDIDSEQFVPKRLWKIPVCYDTVFAKDLEGLSALKQLSENGIVELHSTSRYSIHFIGFLPGFLYLEGLPKPLCTPRKSVPDPHIEKGSVAIGGNQTGIYPIDSPGGWHVIGNSPLDFFDPNSAPPCFASPGDMVSFVPIDKNEYDKIKIAVHNNSYEIESEVLHD